MTPFRAFRIHQDDHGHRAGFVTLGIDALTPGEVVVRSEWSSVNYKDALAGTGKGKILRHSPLNGGIDVAGTVVASTDPAYREGDVVLATGSGLSETIDGGYAQYVRLPSAAVIPLPATLTAREAMIIGTAGYTAALALLHMTDNRQTPSMGPVAITGATGGVGMLAIDIFSSAGYEVHAVSGKTERFEALRKLGASQCIDRHTLVASGKPLDRARYGGLLDTVGGPSAALFLPQIVPYGNAAICGQAAGSALTTTVMPFILRGVNLLGVASAGSHRDVREDVWRRLAGDWRPHHLDAIATRDIPLDDLPTVFHDMIEGRSFGRTVVNIGAEP